MGREDPGRAMLLDAKAPASVRPNGPTDSEPTLPCSCPKRLRAMLAPRPSVERPSRAVADGRGGRCHGHTEGGGRRVGSDNRLVAGKARNVYAARCSPPPQGRCRAPVNDATSMRGTGPGSSRTATSARYVSKRSTRLARTIAKVRLSHLHIPVQECHL